MTNLTEFIIKKINIPHFLDDQIAEHHVIYDNIQKVVKVFNLCIVDTMISEEGLEDINTYYWSYMLRIYSASKELYSMTVKFITEIYDDLMKTLEEENLFEAAYNLYHITNPASIIEQKQIERNETQE